MQWQIHHSKLIPNLCLRSLQAPLAMFCFSDNSNGEENVNISFRGSSRNCKWVEFWWGSGKILNSIVLITLSTQNWQMNRRRYKTQLDNSHVMWSFRLHRSMIKLARYKLQLIVWWFTYIFQFPRDVCKQAWKLGLINTCIPVEYGNLFDSHTFMLCLGPHRWYRIIFYGWSTDIWRIGLWLHRNSVSYCS